MPRDTITPPPAEQLARLPEDLVKAAAEVVGLRERQAEGHRSLNELEDSVGGATEKDVQASADALRAGNPDPGRKATAKVEKAIEQQKSTLEGLAVAVGDAERDLAAMAEGYVDTHGDQLQQDIDEQRAECRKTAELLATNTDELRVRMALRDWLRNPASSYRPSAFAARRLNITKRNGEGASLQEVIAALLDVFTPPEPPAEGPPASPLWPKAQLVGDGS